ncbi:TonB-dependent receptor [Edaphobacter sp. 12200R-103]|uniref:TonB-dependent receptor n=1 Tax=Edaphobacter sp. 12200R-103 TaxID=2703788 RepID=UPI00138D8519|nr:carboxypeptidase regulatory-like domain-containing protein [Edaphobacter sp. 12200R-103]QHS52675.1 TonB-dependent receptor [Edaphobacter sp. 12200R-103]
MIARCKPYLPVGLCLFSLTCLAQSPQGTIAGTITDASGAAIAGAAVTAVSLQTNDTRTATTNGAGAYRIEAVLPGDYKISATAESFGTTSAPSAHVTSSVVTSVNLVLQAGGATASVDVSAEGELLRTDSGELSNTLNMQEVQTLPVSSLNPYALATTLPGVSMVKTVDLTNGTSFSVNGSRPRDNNFLIEGMDNNDQGLHGQAFQPANTEAIEEVTFLLNSFSSEFGHGGSVSNLIYRSGSNQFHGAVWDRLLNSSLNATDHADVLAGNPKNKSRENIFGFRIGGPIVKDRAFFFVSTQWDRLRQTANLGVLTLPTPAGYAKLQQYSSNPRIANLLKAYGDLRGTNPNFAKTLALGKDPVTQIDRGTVDFAGVQRSLGSQVNSYELVAKVDVNLRPSDKLQMRYIHAPQNTPYDTQNFPNQLPGFDTQQSGIVDNAGLTETHIFSSNLLNELRLSWSRIGFTFGLRPETAANPLAQIPAVSIAGVTGFGVPAGSVPQGRFHNTYQLQDAVSWTHGKHSLKVGFDVADIRIRDQIPFNYMGSIAYSDSIAAGYRSLGNYLDDFGGSSTNSGANIQFGNPIARPQIWSQNYYAQDTWKMMPNLSMDFGVRYEYNGTPFNSLGYPGFNSSDPACFPCNVRQQGDRNNIAPRIGFNYSPFAKGKTVISGGFGLFYDHIFSNIIANIQGSSPNAATKLILNSRNSPRGTADWSGVLDRITNKNPLPTDTSNVITSHLLDPENYQWNLRVQQELPADFVLSVAYVGNRGVHQYATTEFNPRQSGGPRLFPTRGRIIREDNTNDSMYHAGQVNLEHKMQHGVMLRAAYTFAKNMDTGSELFTPSDGNWSTYAERQYPNPRGLEWGPSAFDNRHVFSLTYLYNPPVWHAEGSKRFAAAVANHWTIAGITSMYSGSPINVETSDIYDWNGDGIGNDRPMLANPKAPIGTYAIHADDFFDPSPGGYCDGAYAFTTNDDCHPVTLDQVHWVLAPYLTQGHDIRRNSLYSPFNQQWDMSVQRGFHIGERHTIDFRAESFNVFNHALTNQPATGSQPAHIVNSTLTSGILAPGQGTSTFLNYGLTHSGGRTLRFLLKYSF